MDAVTYPNKAVKEFIQANMIPLRVLYDQKPLADDFKVLWTPTLITLDVDGKEHNRTVGFLPPEELIPSLTFGIGKVYFDRGEFNQAITKFKKVSVEYPKSDWAPESVYYLGVARYKATNDLKALAEIYKTLSTKYPGSEWTKRAYPYRSIK